MDSSHGVHRTPLHRHDRRCVHSRLNRRSGFGPKPPRSGLVPFLPFLPASTVFSAAARDPKITSLRRPAGLLHPAAGRGFTTFPSSCTAFGRPSSVSGVTIEAFLVAKTLRSFPLSWQPDRPSPPASLRRRTFTDRRALSSWVPRASCCVSAATLRGTSSSGLSSAGRVRCRSTAFPLHWARCSHGLWIVTFGCLPRTGRRMV